MMASVSLPAGPTLPWRIRDLRRRPWLLALLAVAVLALGVLACLELQRTIDRLERDRGPAALRYAAAERAVAEITRLERTPLPPGVDARAVFDRVLAASPLRGTLSQSEWNDGRVRVTLANARFDQVVTWLDVLQRDAGLRPLEATLSALAEPGLVRAELVLGR